MGFCTGEVAHPGKYQLKSFTSVLQAVSLAGDSRRMPPKSKMFLFENCRTGIRKCESRLTTTKFVSGEDSTHNAILVPGDTLVVP